MSQLNDKRILELKNKIKDKKEQLKNSSGRFTPITNCSIELENERYNINVLTRDQLITLLVKLNIYKISAKELDLLDEFIISGYKIEEWIEDIKSKIDMLSRKEEERKLKAMESKLEKLLSEDKKVELELNEIESLLKSN